MERAGRSPAEPQDWDRYSRKRDRKSERKTDQKATETETWTRLHDEARSHYEEIPASKGNRLWLIVFVAAVVVLIASVIGVINKFSQLQGERDQVILTAQAAAQGTAAAAAQVAIDATATAFFQLVTVPTNTPAPTLEAAVVSDTPAPAEPLPTATQSGPPLDPLNCVDIRNFALEVVSGPNLMPSPGSIFIRGVGDPTVQASWVIKNTGTCAWKVIDIESTVGQESLTPLVKYDGKNLFLNTTGLDEIPSGAEVELVVGYRAVNARNVDREYVFQINGFDLIDQPHLRIQVTNWVTGVNPTATPNTPKPRPPSEGGGEKPPETRP